MNVPLSAILGRLTPALAVRILTATFQVLDVLFYAIAVYPAAHPLRSAVSARRR